MHKAGGPPDPKVPMEVHMERRFANIYEFYLEYRWLAEHTPSSFAEDVILQNRSEFDWNKCKAL